MTPVFSLSLEPLKFTEELFREWRAGGQARAREVLAFRTNRGQKGGGGAFFINTV